jgi:hypothetical protein
MGARWDRRVFAVVALGWFLGGPALAAAASTGGGHASAGGAHGGGHGGHGARGVAIVGGFGGAQMLLPVGVPAIMPTTLTDEPVGQVAGDFAPGDVVAQHVLRPREARILLAPVTGSRGLLPAGTALAHVVTPVQGLSLWCEIGLRRDWLKGAVHDCLSETHDMFDRLWVGESETHFLAAGDGVVRQGALLPAPVAFRDARPEERPTAQLGFRWCDGDGLTAPPRFAVAVTTTEDGRWKTAGDAGCRFGVWTDPADRAHVDVDGLQITVTPGTRPPRLHMVVAGRLAPLAELEPLTATWTGRLAPAADAKPAGGSGLSTLVSDGAPIVVATGPIAPGQSFLQMPVRHALTGSLAALAHLGAAWDDQILRVDQPVFGLRTGGDEPGIVWCAPRQQVEPGHGSAGKWVTTCVAEREGGSFAMQIPVAMIATSLPWSSARATKPIEVRPGPVQLPPMTLSYVFLGFTDPSLPTRFARVEMRLDWGEGPRAVRTLSAPVEADGVAKFGLLGGRFDFRFADPATPAKRGGGRPVQGAQLAVGSPPRPAPPI